MALGYRLPGTTIEEVSKVGGARPTSAQRRPCFVGKASPWKLVDGETLIRSSTGDVDTLTYGSEGIGEILQLGSQRGLDDFVSGVHYNLTTSTGDIEWIINQEAKVVALGGVGFDLINALSAPLDTAIDGEDPTSGYQDYGFNAAVAASSPSGLDDDATSGEGSWGFTGAKAGSDISDLDDSTFGLQGWGFSGVAAGSDDSGLDNSTEGYAGVASTTLAFVGVTVPALTTGTYDIDITIDGGALGQLNVSLNAADDWDTIAAAIETALQIDTGGNETVVISGGKIVVTSETTGSTSSVLIADGTAGTGGAVGNLLAEITSQVASMTTSLDTPVAGVNTTTTYTCIVTIDGIDNNVEIAGITAITMTLVCSEIEADLSGATCTFDEGNDEILITSETTGNNSTIVITDTDLFSSLDTGTATGNANPETAVDGVNSTTVYTASVTVDGSVNAISVSGINARTLTNVCSEINNDLSGATCTFNEVDDEILIESTSEGTSSTIVITDTDLFASITDANGAAETPVDGTNGTAYTATITIDGGGNAVSINGFEAQTLAEVVDEINNDITGGVASFEPVTDVIRITSNSTGASSVIAITDGTLFASLTNSKNSVEVAVDGVNIITGYQEFGLVTTGGSGTGLVADTIYYFKVNDTEYSIKTVTGELTFAHIVALMDAVVTGDGVTVTFVTEDIRITHDTSGNGYDITIAAGTTRDASDGELEVTLSSGLTYARIAGKCIAKFTPDNGVTNYDLGIKNDLTVGALSMVLTGDVTALEAIDQNGTGTENDLTFENQWLVPGATYFCTYKYIRPDSDYMVYKEFIKFEDLIEDLGDEAEYRDGTLYEHDLVMVSKLALKTYGVPSIAVVQVPYTTSGGVADISYSDALDAIKFRDVQTVALMNISSNVRAALKSHVIERSLPDNGRYRMGYMGAEEGTEIGDETDSDSLRGIAVAVKNERCVFINATRAKYFYRDPTSGEELETTVDGGFVSAAIAAYRDSLSSPVSTTLNHTIPGIALFEEDYEDYYSEYLLTLAGSSSCFLLAPAGGLTKVIDDLTTENATIEKNNINIITAKDYIARDVAIQMDRVFKGQLIIDRALYQDQVQGFLKNLFDQYKANNVIEAIGTLTVTLPTTQRDTVNIFYGYFAVYTHKYTVGQFAIEI